MLQPLGSVCRGRAPPASGDAGLVVTTGPACQHSCLYCLQWTWDAHRHVPVPKADPFQGTLSVSEVQRCVFFIALKEKLRHRAGKHLVQSQQSW